MLQRLKQNVVRKLFYYEMPTAEELMAHFEQEQARRAKIEEQMKMVHESASTSGSEQGDESAEASKNPDEIRAKREEQKRARRKQRR
jgi:citrate synthase